VRNPWGRETYRCDYGNESSMWTPELRIEAGVTSGAVNEGIFFMKVEDYLKQGSQTLISFDTTEWFNDHFLMLNDRTKSPGSWSWCGPTCTRHLIEVTSDVAQDVFVTAHTWEPRSYPAECRKRNFSHSVYMDGAYTIDLFREGSAGMKPITFAAGQTNNFTLEFDWARDCITPDWSLTAWAEHGKVTVRHKSGLQSEALPYIEKKKIESVLAAPVLASAVV